MLRLLQKTAVAVLSVSCAASVSAFGLEKRFSNSSCAVETTTSTAIVSVWGPEYTGVPSNQFTAPTIQSEWVAGEGPVFNIYVPQADLTGVELIADELTGLDFDKNSYVLYTGDVGDFIYPGEIYSTFNDGLIFKGRTQDPLLKIVASGDFDQSVPVFIAVFELDLDVAASSAAILKKRETKVYTLSASLDNPLFSSASATATATASSSASAAVAPVTAITGVTAESSSSSAESSAATSITGVTAESSSSAESSATGAPAATTITGVTAESSNSAEYSITGVTAESTVVTGSTITKTITSCSDNKCSASVATGVESVFTTTVDDVVSTVTQFCAQAVGGPSTAVTVVPIDTTVTVGSVVTLISTYCPVVNGEIVTTLTADTETTVITLTEFTTAQSWTSVSESGVESVTGTATGTVTGTATGITSAEEHESTIATVLTSAAPSESISIYEAGAAAKSSNVLAGGLVGLVGMIMML